MCRECKDPDIHAQFEGKTVDFKTEYWGDGDYVTSALGWDATQGKAVVLYQHYSIGQVFPMATVDAPQADRDAYAAWKLTQPTEEQVRMAMAAMRLVEKHGASGVPMAKAILKKAGVA